MYHLGTWFCGQFGSAGLTVGPDDLRGFFQPKQFCDSVPSPALEEESHAVPRAGAGHSEWAGASPAHWQQAMSGAYPGSKGRDHSPLFSMVPVQFLVS